MPRIFLAPYRFKIQNKDENFDFIEFLKRHEGKHHKNEDDMTEFILKSVNVEKDKVWGYFQYGKYGTLRPVVNVDTGKVTKRIQKRESPLDDYFYLIEYNKNNNTGFMILQRIGNIGVRSRFVQATYNWGKLIIKVEPVILELKDLLKNPIMEIRIKVPKRPKDIDSRFDKIKISNDDDVYVEVSIKAKRNKVLQLADDFRKKLQNYDLKNIGYIYDESEETSIVVKVGDSQRTINVTKGRVRTWMEVEDISKIKEEAEKLLTKVKTEAAGE